MRTATNDINENRTGRTTTSDIAIDKRVEVWRRREGRGVIGERMGGKRKVRE